MEPSVVVIAVLVLAVAIVAMKAIGGRRGVGSGSLYQLQAALFTPAERSFLGVLDKAVGAEHRVFGKVRLADIVAVKSTRNAADRQRALNRIVAKHFDFVVCRANDLSMVCVVELNDKSHTRRRTQARDELVADICRSIDLPLMVMPAKAAYSVQEVRERFLAAIAAAPQERGAA